jgi:hypothetical protein
MLKLKIKEVPVHNYDIYVEIKYQNIKQKFIILIIEY